MLDQRWMTQVLTKDKLRLLQEGFHLCYGDLCAMIILMTYVLISYAHVDVYVGYHIQYMYVLMHTVSYISYPNVGSGGIDSHPRGQDLCRARIEDW